MIRNIAFACLTIAAALAGSPAHAFPIGPFPDLSAVTVQEYVNDITGHYFLVSEQSEKAFIDNGGAGPGWHATGHSFGAYSPGASKGAAVCRFYAASPNTHFFTLSPEECALLRDNDWGWTYEGVHFRVDAPVDGACSTASTPIHRLYNNRFQFNDSNHRYVAEADVRAAMVAAGWTDEGAAFCATGASYVPALTFAVQPKAIRPVTECENEDLNPGSCIGMNGLSSVLPTQVVSWVPPFFVTRGPFWNDAFGDLTGSYDEDVYTAQPAADTAAILGHSFVQVRSFVSPYIGVHVASADALSPLASIEPLYQFPTRPPAAGAAERRIFPWYHRIENYLDLSFDATVKTARRADGQSHAYGAPMIELRDVKSGDAIDVTMLTYATFPSGDFVGSRDPVTGNVTVSTSFTPRTMFGTRLSGDFIPLGGMVPPPSKATHFAFRIGTDDFAKIVQLARGSNPALSQDVRDYLLVNFRFRNGILGNAELGATISNLGLSVYGY